jgi:hypothetical protein
VPHHHQVGEEMSTEQISSLLAILPSAEDAELVQVWEMAPRLKVGIASPKALLTPRLRPDFILDVALEI